MIISLVGYMGSGKSSVSTILGKKMHWKVVDLDHFIEEKETKSIKEIFATQGEIYFRKAENKALQSVLSSKENIILSTGGGTPIFYNNMKLLNEKSYSFFLSASPVTLAQRLAPGKSHRPLIAHLSDTELTEFVAKHLFERNPFYLEAHHKIDTDLLSNEEVALTIIDWVKNQSHQNRP